MQSNNYIVIQGWMCNELELKGNELLIFALIHGFSQDGVSKYYGGRKYIADTFNISLPTVDKALQGLLDKEYIVKHISGDYINPDSYWSNLDVVKKLYEGSKETLHGGSKETLLNKTNKQTDRKKEKNSSKEELHSQEFQFGKQSKPKKANLYTKCVDMINDFTDSEMIRSDLHDYLYLLMEMRKDGKPFYTNTWKGLLRKLKEISSDPNIQHDSILYSMQKGYIGFYDPKDRNFSSKPTDVRKGKAWEEGLSCETYTEEEKREIDRQTAEREAMGEQVWY